MRMRATVPDEGHNPKGTPDDGVEIHLAQIRKPPHSFDFIDRDKMRLFKDGDGLTVYDYTLENSMLFSQGDWSMIRRDLELAGVEEEHIHALEIGPCREIIRAYRVRRELIHYKKLCLHLFEEARKIERELKQCMSFFFWNDGDDRQDGIKAHIDAIIALLSYDLNEKKSPIEVDSVKVAIQKHEMGSCTLLDRKILYTLACSAWMHHVGIKKALHDSRDLAKAICMSPRHPDGEVYGERPSKLENLPHSMQIFASLCSAKLEGSRKSKKNQESNAEDTYNVDSNIKKKDISGASSMNMILEVVQKSMNWPKEGIDFLRNSINARGGFKALAIVEELDVCYSHLTKLHHDIQEFLGNFKDLHSKCLSTMSCTNRFEYGDEDDTLGAAVLRLNNIHFFHGASKACKENLKWIHEIKSFGLKFNTESLSKHPRLFVSGDNVHSNAACAFVPKDFELGSFVMISRQILDSILIPCMKASIKIESWPPLEESNRTRVLGFKGTFKAGMKLGISIIDNKKLFYCQGCDGHFHHNWIRHNLCSICEMKRRDDHDGMYCLFHDCKGGKMNPYAFCPHANQCYYCDSPHSCEKFCRLSRGNGELVMELVETIQPNLLLLDFDRTLCSTKAGASPINRKKNREIFTHSIDQDLRASIKALCGGVAHIVTRNSHKEDIQMFLRVNGFTDLAKRIHIVPKKTSKGAFIKNIFFKENEKHTCIFVDDDIRELINDPWMCQQENIHRLHFVRAFL